MRPLSPPSASPPPSPTGEGALFPLTSYLLLLKMNVSQSPAAERVAETGGLDSEFVSTPSVAAPRDDWWYVIRYRTLTAWLKRQMEICELEIFHKYRLSQVKRGTGVVTHEVPILSGYIFVHADFEHVKALAQRLGLHMMRDPFWETSSTSEEDLYVRISHSAMMPFMTAVSHATCNLTLSDGCAYNPDKDDCVAFIDGEMKGTVGYLKPGRGRKGGTVIVPLNARGMGYMLEARQEDLTVIAFAKGNRHAKDCVIDARPTVDAAFWRVRHGRRLSRAMRERLEAFVRRYGQARLNTSTQKAQHYALLFRIHTILGHCDACRELREVMDGEIVPDIVRRRDAALKRGNDEAAARLSKLLKDIKATRRLAPKGRISQ